MFVSKTSHYLHNRSIATTSQMISLVHVCLSGGDKSLLKTLSETSEKVITSDWRSYIQKFIKNLLSLQKQSRRTQSLKLIIGSWPMFAAERE